MVPLEAGFWMFRRTLCYRFFVLLTVHLDKTSLMHNFSLIYFVSQHLHVSGMFIVHHQVVGVIRFGEWQLAGSG
jgi:hypothetical protein